MKKKILSLCLVMALAAVAVVGGTLAYFTDTDSADNTFVVGNVDIELKENFDENNANLLPTTGKDTDGNIINAVKKEVYVKNTGSEKAYVRVHIAIPQVLDNGDPNFDAGKNVLHFNYAADSIGEGKWDWSKAADDEEYAGNWNYYETTINEIKYNVYVVTYGTALAKDVETTENAMHQVYLDSKVTNTDITKINETLKGDWQIKVIAEGAQAVGFDDAYDALNTAFAVPGTYDPFN